MSKKPDKIGMESPKGDDKIGGTTEKAKEDLACVFGVFKRVARRIIEVFNFKKELASIVSEKSEELRKNPGQFFKIFFGELIPEFAEKKFNVKIKAISFFEKENDPIFSRKHVWPPGSLPEEIYREGCEYSAHNDILKLNVGYGCILILADGEKRDIKDFCIFFKILLGAETLNILKMGVKTLLVELKEAKKDKLSGVLKREAWIEVIYSNFKQFEKGAVMFLDLNNFKDINEKWGHAVGDWVIRAFGETLIEVFRKSDPIGRWGGDEFIIAFSSQGREVEEVITSIGEKMEEKIQQADFKGIVDEGKEDALKEDLLRRLSNGNINEKNSNNQGKYNFVAIGKVPWADIFKGTIPSTRHQFEETLQAGIKCLSGEMYQHKKATKNGEGSAK